VREVLIKSGVSFDRIVSTPFSDIIYTKLLCVVLIWDQLERYGREKNGEGVILWEIYRTTAAYYFFICSWSNCLWLVGRVGDCVDTLASYVDFERLLSLDSRGKRRSSSTAVVLQELNKLFVN
jgi:hypothetical protein